MSNEKNSLSSSDIIDNISENLEKPNFLYEGSLEFDDLYNNVKKHPIDLYSVVECGSKFLILVAIYFFIANKFSKPAFLNFFIIPILFIISIWLTIKKIKKNIYKAVAMSNAKFYFYDNFLIAKSENSIEKVPYNNILFIKEKKSTIVIATKLRTFIIQKSKIDDKFYDFLKKLMNQYKNIHETSDDVISWDCLHRNMGEYKLYCISNKNKSTLKYYYHTKRVYIISYLYVMCINFIVISGIYSLFNIFFYTPTEIIFFIIFVNISTIICMPNYFKSRVKILLKTEQEKIYFYDEFFLIKTKENIIKFDYDSIKLIVDSDKLLFLKVKKVISPMVINKQILDTKEFNLYSKIKASK